MSPVYHEILRRVKRCARELDVHAPVKVLLADDDLTSSSYLAKRLRRSARAAFEVTCVNMEQAAVAIRAQRHDIYALDATPGSLGGLEIIRTMHEDEGLHFPFVLMTCEPVHPEVIADGCLGLYVKPVEPDAMAVGLLDAVKNYSLCHTAVAA